MKIVDFIFRLVVIILPFFIIAFGRLGLNMLHFFNLNKLLPFLWVGIIFIWIIISKWEIKKIWYFLLWPIAFFETYFLKILSISFGG
jgi:hypothetical protein